MGSATHVEEFDESFEFTPVEGCSNEYIIHARIPARDGNTEKVMTPADWDKFEKDITDAFEQIP